MGRDGVIASCEKNIESKISGRNVLFISTKGLDYIRNTQELNIIKKHADQYEIVGSYKTNYLARLIKIYVKLLFMNCKKFDTVFIGFAPQLILPFWRFKFKKKTIMIDFFISLYDTFVNDRRKVKSNSIIGRLLKKMDMCTLKKADQIICDTRAHGEYFCKDLGADTNRIDVLYLNADKEIYYSRYIKKSEKLKDRFVVLYFGSVLPLQGVNIVLDAYRLLKDDNRFYFYMVGPVEKKYEKPVSDNIEYISWLPQEKLADLIATSDLCLAGHFNSGIEKAKRTIPGKAYIYDAMKKKIILGDNPANRELLSDEDKGVYFVEMGSAVALANKIREINNEVNNELS